MGFQAIEVQAYPQVNLADKLAISLLKVFSKPKKTIIVLGIVFFFAINFACLLSPVEEAHAIAPIVIALGAAASILGGGIALSGGVDQMGQNIETALCNTVNFLLASGASAIESITSTSMLTQKFSELFPSIYSIIQTIQDVAVAPAANIILIIMLLIGLGGVLKRLNQSEAGADLWELCMVFVLYAFAKAVVDSSFSLMILAFDIARMLILGIYQAGQITGSFEVSGISSDVADLGALIVLFIVALITFFICWAVAIFSQLVVIARSVQIYVYTILAPLSLSFLVADSTRPVATGFIKRYIAVLLAGAIMALLFIMMGAIIGTITVNTVSVNNVQTLLEWIGQLLFSMVYLLAFAFCLGKSGAWARDFLGI